MPQKTDRPLDEVTPEFTRGFDGHRRAQARQGLRMTPAQRLRWLEETMEALRRWQGRARKIRR
jgi:hypothetical protein